MPHEMFWKVDSELFTLQIIIIIRYETRSKLSLHFPKQHFSTKTALFAFADTKNLSIKTAEFCR
jgi:hypothetical protein